MFETSTEGVAIVSCVLKAVAEQGVQLAHPVFHVLLRCALRFDLLSFHLEVIKAAPCLRDSSEP